MTSELVERAQRGDREAFDDLATAAYHRLYAIARRILRDGYAAEDAVQDALVKAWRELRGLRDAGAFDAWLHRLLVNACRDHARRTRRRVIELPELPIEREEPRDNLAQLADRDVTIELSEPAKAWLIANGYDEQMGARPMARVIQEHIKKPLADEVLFGQLKGGGHVRVVLVKDEATEKDKIGFEFVEGPVTPKPEKLPGARKRSTAPRKPKPPGGSGGGGSRVPPSRGPLVKV